MLQTVPYKLLSLKDLKIKTKPQKLGKSLKANANQKARFYSKVSGLLTVADDTGLFVKSLKGFPGLNSNLKQQHTIKDKNLIILQRLKGKNDRRAYVKTLISLAKKGKVIKNFTGRLVGEISKDLNQKKMPQGFHFDRLFYLPELNLTLADLTHEKNKISHRGQAINKLAIYLTKIYRVI